MKVSAESCTDSVLVSVYVEDMAPRRGWFKRLDGSISRPSVVRLEVQLKSSRLAGA
jgi:hypothetical protein